MTSAFNIRVKAFEDALGQERIDLRLLRCLCFNGIPDVKSLRAQCWKLLLGYLDTDRSSWTVTLSRKRQLYKQFVEELVLPPGLYGVSDRKDPRIDDCEEDNNDQPLRMSVPDDHPLNEGPDSAWNTFFNDNEILLQIDKDVRRLYPDISFFQQPTEFPCDIVVYSKGERRLHQRVVPPILKSANVERKGLGITKINLITKHNEETYEAMDEGQEAHWEVVQRILFLYAKLNPGQGYVQGMNEIVGPIYYVMASDPSPEQRALMAEIRDFFIKTLDDSECGIKNMMKRLSRMLEQKDLQIYERLKSQKLHPQYYSFRWISLILSQEFALPDVLRIWDSVFSEEERFNFLLKICCAMILIQRNQLLKNDFASNVKLLQNYPPMDINIVLARAVSL